MWDTYINYSCVSPLTGAAFQNRNLHVWPIRSKESVMHIQLKKRKTLTFWHIMAGLKIIWTSGHSTWRPCSHWDHQELFCIPKYSRVKCEARLKLGHAIGQWSGANGAKSRCCSDPVKVQTSTWLKWTCKLQWTRAVMERKVGETSLTMIWETDNIIMRMITLTYCC